MLGSSPVVEEVGWLTDVYLVKQQFGGCDVTKGNEIQAHQHILALALAFQKVTSKKS